MLIHCLRDINADSIGDLIEKIAIISSEITKQNRDNILSGLKEREELSPTAIGKGVLLPHIRLENITDDYLFFIRLDKPLVYKSPDGINISLVFFIMSPSDRKTEYLKLVSLIAKMIKNDETYKRIMTINDQKELESFLQEHLLQKGQ